MARIDHAESSPTSDWLQRFAGTLLALAPQIRPLDAVRRAMQSYPAACDQAPEEAAQQHASLEWPDSEAPAALPAALAGTAARRRQPASQRPPRG